MLSVPATFGGAADAETVRDDFGRPITLEKPPERILALGHHAYSQLAALGVRPSAAFVNPRYAAMTELFFDRPEQIPSLMHAAWSADLEKVLAAKPDLVVGHKGSDTAPLMSVTPYFAVADHQSIEAMTDNLLRLGHLLGREQAARDAIDALNRRIAKVDAVIDDDDRIAWVMRDASGGLSFVTRRHLTCQLIEAVATCVSATSTFGQIWVQTDISGLIEMDPDIILLSNWSEKTDETVLAELEDDAGWEHVRALVSGHVYFYDGYQDLSVRGLPTALRLLDILIAIDASENPA